MKFIINTYKNEFQNSFIEIFKFIIYILLLFIKKKDKKFVQVYEIKNIVF